MMSFASGLIYYVCISTHRYNQQIKFKIHTSLGRKLKIGHVTMTTPISGSL